MTKVEEILELLKTQGYTKHSVEYVIVTLMQAVKELQSEIESLKKPEQL